jgi:hypothetical protein
MLKFAEVSSSLDNDNTAATVSFTVDDNQTLFITGILASYDDLSVDGELKIEVDSNEEFTHNFTGNFELNSTLPITFQKGGDVTITLSSSGTAGTLGDLVVFHKQKYHR